MLKLGCRTLGPALPAAMLAAALLSAPRPAAAAGPAALDVMAFGAKCDGVSDDSAALRAAANAVPATGAELRFPRAVCATSRTIYLKSHTHVRGSGSTLLAIGPWSSDHEHGLALLENMHYGPGPVIDADMSVTGMTFDYGKLGPAPVPGGGKHAVRFDFARDIVVSGNVFQLRGAEDAVAGLGVVNMRVQDNKAYEFRNCAYDFWFGPSNVQVIGNYAETAHSSQMVNFNPERTSGDSAGMLARGFLLQGNTLVTTGPKAAPIQLEPLGAHTSVRDVTVTGNTLRNVYLVLRGDVGSATIRGNTFDHVAGGASAFETYPWNGGTASGIVFADNKILDPQTVGGEVAVVRMEAANASVTGNTIAGSGYRAAPIGHGTFPAADRGNTITR